MKNFFFISLISILALSNSVFATTVVINSSITLCGTNNTWANNDLVINATVSVCPWVSTGQVNCNSTIGGSTNCGYVRLYVSNFTLLSGKSINGDSSGYSGGTEGNSGSGNGAGIYSSSCGSGAGYGGTGGNGIKNSFTVSICNYNSVSGGSSYGSSINVTDMGSGGGGGSGSGGVIVGGAGGGFVYINATNFLILNGTISLNGGNGNNSISDGGGAGGGSGGGLYLISRIISGVGTINLNGGKGGNGAGLCNPNGNGDKGGGGAGGRSYIEYSINSSFAPIISVSGGAGGSGDGLPYGGAGSIGTINFSVNSNLNNNPSFSENLKNQTATTSTTFNYDINCTDADGDTITYYDNTSLFNINSANGNITDTPTENEQGNYTILITCGDGYVNTSQSFIYTINDTTPNIASASINNTGAEDDNDVKCNNGTMTQIFDSPTIYYDWLKNSASQGINSVNLSASHTTTGDQWQCRIWVDNGYQNSTNVTSATVQIASSFRAPTINWTNATSLNGIASTITNPTNNNSQVNLSVTFDDENAGDVFTAFFCKTDSATSSGCAISWCNSSINQSSKTLSCNFSVRGLSASQTYYAFVLSNDSLISASTSGSFKVNHPPNRANITAPVNDTWRAFNHTYFTFSGDDDDGDTVNYTLWCNNAQLYSGSNDYYNWTNITDGYYNCTALSTDQHNYQSTQNSSVILIKIDATAPTISSQQFDASSIYTDDDINLTFICSDSLSGVDTSSGEYDIVNPTESRYGETMLWNGSLFYDSVTIVSTAGTYNVTNLYCSDIAGNSYNYSLSNLTFTTSVRTSGTTTGGSAGEIIIRGVARTVVPADTWSITTIQGSDQINVILSKDSVKPRSKTMRIVNTGNKNVNITLYCDTSNVTQKRKDNSSIDVCDFVTFSQNTVNIEANNQKSVEVNINVYSPFNSSFGDSYYFNVFGLNTLTSTDTDKVEEISKLSVKADSSILGIFFKWNNIPLGKLESDKQPIAYPTIIPSSIMAIIVFTVIMHFLYKDMPLTSFFLGILGFMISFFGMLLIL